jgi:hypothetical protein
MFPPIHIVDCASKRLVTAEIIAGYLNLNTIHHQVLIALKDRKSPINALHINCYFTREQTVIWPHNLFFILKHIATSAVCAAVDNQGEAFHLHHANAPG